MERRITGSECRVEIREDGTNVAVGHAAVFHREGEPGTEYELWEGTVERIDPAAFDAALGRPDDVRALFNHDSDHLLGRSTAGTLRLSVDSRGLRYEIDLPDTTIGRDVATSIDRGDLTGSSFAFVPEVTEWRSDGDKEVRVIQSARLFDVGPVTYPAYTSATAAMRSLGDDPEAREECDAWHYAQREAGRDARARRARARLVDFDLLGG